MDGYNLLFYPYPIMLSREHTERIAAWVEAGGTLICQGLPGYFDENGRVGTLQPGVGLDRLFGAVEDAVELLPDLSNDIVLEWEGLTVQGGLYRQSYRCKGGVVRGRYTGGEVAVVECALGKGRALLFGTFPSARYFASPSEENRRFFARVLTWAGRKPAVTVSRREITARLYEGAGGRFLWVLNPQKRKLEVRVQMRSVGNLSVKRVLWGEGDAGAGGRSLLLSIPGQDAVVMELG